MTLTEPAPVIANTAGQHRTVTRKRRSLRPLSGWIERQMDRKGRTTLPYQWRSRFAAPFYLVPRADGRLYVIRAHQWEQLLAGRGRHPLYEDASTATAAVLVPELMPQSRFTVPYELRRACGLLKGEVVWLIGRGDCFEIISRDRWLKEQAT